MQPNTAIRPRRRPGITSKRVASRRAQVLDRIVAAAGRLMGARGTAAVSVEQILRAARVSRGTFYSYFANRSQLIAAIVGPALRDGIALLGELERQPVEQALAGVIDVYLELWDRHRAALVITPDVDAESFARIRRLHDAFIDALRSTLARGAGTPWLRTADADLALQVLTRTAIPLLRVYSKHPQGHRLYRESMRALLLGEPR